jgi:ABC-2 type transport system permease protein
VTELTGTAALVRSIVRRDRVRILVWISGIVGLTLASAAGVDGIYPTAADLQRAARLVEGNAVAIAFNGPVQGLETLGGRIAFETGAFTLVLVGLMSLFMLGRNTRSEEESGRLELVRATVVGRHAPIVAALVVVAAMNLVTGVALAAGFVALDLPPAGSISFGVSVVAVGLVFTAITAVTAQVSDNSRVTSGLAGLAVGVAYALRAVGDTGGGALSWLSPIGWGQKLRPFAGEVWWPLVVPFAFSAGCLVLAAVLGSHRDVGGGLVQPRPGPASAAPSLGHPLGLALRLQRGAVIAWGTGVLALALVYGSLADEIDRFVEDLDENVRELIARSGTNLTDSFFGTTLLILALLGSGFAVQATLRLRSEEALLHAEPLLSTPVSRARWVGSHVAVAVGGSIVMLAAGGVGLGLSYGLTVGDLGEVPRKLVEALVYLPAMGVLIGIGLVLFGWAPRAAPLVWALLVACFVIGFFGEILDLPAWVMGISPFEHTPLVPAEDLRALPLATLTTIALGLGAAGLWGFRVRDLVSP